MTSPESPSFGLPARPPGQLPAQPPPRSPAGPQATPPGSQPAPQAATRAERRKRKLPAALEPGDHLNALDGVRAIAVFSVVATHVGFQTGRAVNGFWAPLLARLDFGVTLFFLLSGFLLYRPFVSAAIDLRRPPDVRRFLSRRVARIIPAYWLLLAATMLLRPWEHSTGFTVQKTTLTDWLEYATLTHIYFGDNPHQALTHIWSLVVEMSFYLALPLIAALSLRGTRPHRIMRRQTTALGVLIVAGPLYGLIVHQIPVLREHLALQWLPAYLDWFALGMLLACLPAAASVGAWTRLRKIIDDLAVAPGTCWIIAAGLFALAMTPVAGPYSLADATTSQWVAKHVLYGACAFMLLLPLVVPGDPRHPLRAGLANRRVRWLGEVSYGVFLYHLVIMFTLVDVLHLPLFRGGFFTLFPLTVVAALIAAAISYRLMERPILNRVRKRTSGGAPGTGADASGSGAAAGATRKRLSFRGWEALPGPGAGAKPGPTGRAPEAHPAPGTGAPGVGGIPGQGVPGQGGSGQGVPGPGGFPRGGGIPGQGVPGQGVVPRQGGGPAQGGGPGLPGRPPAPAPWYPSPSERNQPAQAHGPEHDTAPIPRLPAPAGPHASGQPGAPWQGGGQPGTDRHDAALALSEQDTGPLPILGGPGYADAPAQGYGPAPQQPPHGQQNAWPPAPRHPEP